MTMEIAGETRSDARMETSEGAPRYEKNATLTVGRGTGPRQRPRNPTIAGDRPPRYEKKRHPRRRARACPSPSLAQSNHRGGQAPALRRHRDQEVYPTVLHRDREVYPTEKTLRYETPSFYLLNKC